MAIINNNLKNIHANNHHYHNTRQYDEESVDTYQMEMGEDFEMPSIANQKKLRQTALVPKDKWETFTVRNKGKETSSPMMEKPSKNNYQLSKGFHESAGNNFFSQFHEKNKR